MEENKSLTKKELVQIETDINECLKPSRNVFENLNALGELLKRLKKRKINLNFYDTAYLIENNKVLNNMLRNIAKVINEKGVNFVSSNILVENLLEDYCAINDIELYYSERDCDSMSDSVKMYFKDISKYKLLNIDEEKELATKSKNGDKLAKDKLVKHNLRLVINIAKKYVHRGMDYLDIIQNGNMGLIKAVEKYDVDKGYKFSTYATWWIRQAITRGFHEQQKLIRKPVYLEEEIAKMRRTEDRLADKLGDNPSYEQLAKELNVSVERIKELKMVGQNIVSLNEVIGEDDESTELEDFIVAEDNTEEEALSNIMNGSLLEICENIGLKERELEILKYRHGFYNNQVYTLEEVGSIYNITRERVRQIEAKALRKLRYHLMNCEKYAVNLNGVSRKRQIS